MSYLIRKHIRHPVVTVSLFAYSIDEGKIEPASVKYGQYTTHNGKKAVLSDNRVLQEYADVIKDFLDKKSRDLSHIKLALDGYTDFQRSVLQAARKIPWGKTVSYKELAGLSGYPNAVRAVASVMRNNPFPLIIPCHRVIRSDGSIGGFAGQQRGKMVKLKRALLEREGITLH